MSSFFKRQAVIVFFLALSSFTFSFEAILSVSDSSDIRSKIVDSWFSISIPELLEKESEIIINRMGQPFQIRVVDYGAEVATAVIPRQNDYSFPIDAKGSWILFREKITGEITRILYYFQPDSNVYLQIRAQTPKNLADMVIFGMYTALGVPIGVDTKTLLTKPFSFVYNLTKNTIPWEYVKITPYDYTSIFQMITLIREKLYLFEYIDQAAYDENNQAVNLSNGSNRTDTPARLGVGGEGFIKWIIDGLVLPIIGKPLEIATLKESTVEMDNTLFATQTKQNDSYKGLNWTRNLAKKAISSTTGYQLSLKNAGTDITSNFFSAFLTPENNFGGELSYTKDIGYHIDILLPLMYVLAAEEPSYFFLAAIRKNESQNNDIWKFDETLALFPYFDSQGKFQLVIFESGQETSFEDFQKRNVNTFIHLSRIKAGDRFVPLTPLIMSVEIDR